MTAPMPHAAPFDAAAERQRDAHQERVHGVRPAPEGVKPVCFVSGG